MPATIARTARIPTARHTAMCIVADRTHTASTTTKKGKATANTATETGLGATNAIIKTNPTIVTRAAPTKGSTIQTRHAPVAGLCSSATIGCLAETTFRRSV